ncbi:MAG: hypothetical protein AB8I08_38720 [Sandaracinaceae bacterium]
MSAVRTWIQLGRNDLRLVLRDRMLLGLLVMVLLMGLGGRYALPAIDASLAANGLLPSESTDLRFRDTFPLFVAFLRVWQVALLPGTAFGFLLLDEKEDRTLTALQVTPLPLSRYLRYRVALPAGFAFVSALLLGPILGHAPVPWHAALALSAGAAVTAPIVTLLLASYADNKVQGLAYTKFGGVAGLSILVGFFVDVPWQWALGVFPPFLVCKAYWLAAAGESGWGLPLFIGTAVQCGLVVVLLRRFRVIAFGA